MAFVRRFLLCGVLAAAMFCLAPFSVRGDVDEVHYFISVGDQGPAVVAKDDQGKKWSSTDHVGKWALVLFFYEGDFMKKCTQQARDMEALHKQIRAEGAEAVGISGDSVETHQLFRKTYKLTYRLLSDYDGKVTYRFGVAKSGGGVMRFKDASGSVVEIEPRHHAGPVDLHHRPRRQGGVQEDGRRSGQACAGSTGVCAEDECAEVATTAHTIAAACSRMRSTIDASPLRRPSVRC